MACCWCADGFCSVSREQGWKGCFLHLLYCEEGMKELWSRWMVSAGVCWFRRHRILLFDCVEVEWQFCPYLRGSSDFISPAKCCIGYCTRLLGVDCMELVAIMDWEFPPCPWISPCGIGY
ncbi:hypothetical protein Nepgr_022923 [Nepenthes gracilis]|uniref:Uncharacterized protein n=1 Tax=Nepenthes gracilis TaxID=150966 RepID=A0AAD3T3F2_NEPGR|nr:hypothetical protein Nepgr_022923 [Nepenthes gracilis]